MADKQLKHKLQYFKELVGELAKENECLNSNSEILRNIYQEVIKLKTSGSMNVFPWRILREACEILAVQIDNQQHLKKRTVKSNVATLTILHILTSSSIDQNVYSEDVIDKVISFVQQQLYICCRESCNHSKVEENRNTDKMIENMQLTMCLLTELVTTQPLVDVQINKISSIGLYIFGNGCNNLKITGIKLLSVIFSKYESQQLSILHDIQEYAVKCGSHEELTPSFPINTSSKNISVFCALVMSLLQNTAVLPKEFSGRNLKISKADSLNVECLESSVGKKYKKILLYSHHVTYEFLEKCLKENGHHFKYYKTVFADFIHDLFSVLMEPEWPVSMILLSDLAKHMANILHNASLSPPILTLCMHWLCEIMVKVKECAQLAERNNEKLDQIISKAQHKLMSCCNNTSDTITKKSTYQHLQSIFIKHLTVKSLTCQSVISLENFYIIMWYSQLIAQATLISEKPNNKKKCIPQDNKENEPSSGLKQKKKKNQKKPTNKNQNLTEATVSFVNSLHNFDNISLILYPSDVKMIISSFICKADIMTHFNIYLTHIMNMLNFKQPSVRAKAMQCLKLLMDADMTFAEKPIFQFIMQHFLNDNCITVREISVELIGQCMIHIPNKCEQFYDLITPHLLDRGISVRKQVLKILRDLTTLYPNFPRLPEVYLKILERIEDPGMKPMVLETFRNRWFTPLNIADKMTDQIKDLNNVVKIAGVTGLHCLRVLMEELLDSNETVRNCKTFVECYVHYLLEREVNNSIQDLCDCLKLLNIIARIKPKILVNYVPTLQPYLSLHHQENESIILSVIGILKKTMPLVENPSETFLSKLEEDLLKLLFVHKHSVVESCVPCLTLIVNEITNNHKLISDSFQMFFGTVRKFALNKFSLSDHCLSSESYIQRCLLITGLFLKHYDFSRPSVQEYFEEGLTDEVFNTFIQLLKNPNLTIQWYTLKAVGEMCCSHSEYLLKNDLKDIYTYILSSRNTGEHMKHQVLRNLGCYLQRESQQTTNKSKQSGRRLKNSVSSQKQIMNLQDEDENSNMSIIIIQQYLKLITNCCICQDQSIRCMAANILQIVVQHGLVPPQKVMAHLIALTTDSDSVISSETYNILQQVDSSHPGIFDFCMRVGINLSYELQILLQKSHLIRGFNGADTPSHALLSPVYKIVQRNKLRRRNFLRIILNQFQDTDVTIDKLLYLSDNLAYLPYKLEDELLFIIQSINIVGATIGYNFLRSFKQQLLPEKSKYRTSQENSSKHYNNESDNEDTETSENLMDQLPEDTKSLQKCVCSFQWCLLLLKVKQYLQKTYEISNMMVALYSTEQDRDPLQLSIDNHCVFITDPYLQTLLEMKAMRSINKEQLIKLYLELKTLILLESDTHPKKSQFYSQTSDSQEKLKEINKIKEPVKLQKNRRGKKRAFKSTDFDASMTE